MRASYLQFMLLLLGLLSCNATKLEFSFDLRDSKVRCIEEERQALLQFKQHLVDPYHWLSSWDSGEDCCKWEGIKCSNKTGHVVMLDLQAEYWWYVESATKHLAGEISSSLLGLQYLTYLDLSLNKFSGKPFPNFVGSLTKLQHLNLSYTYIAGTLPQQLGNLSGLISLDLRRNSDLTEAHNLDWLIHLSSLTYLDMSRVNLSQVVNWPNKLMMLPSLIHLSLSHCSLISTTTPQLFSVNANSSSQLLFLDLSWNNYLTCFIFQWLFNSSTSLVHLDLSYTSGLRCSIPDGFGSLNSLRTLHLAGNQLVGDIPKSFSNLCAIESLTLSDNNLSGSLYEFMSNVSSCLVDSLQDFEISNNRLTGSLPESIRNLSNLQKLDVAKNSLAGVITEAHFSNLLKLKKLSLGLNSLILRFSYDWVPPFQLDYINLRSCRLGSAFPKWLQSQKNYSVLDISDAGIYDIMPAWFWDFPTMLFHLSLSNNQLHGNLPDLSSSRLESTISTIEKNNGSIFYVEYASLVWKGRESVLKSFLGLVKMIDLSNNKLHGEIPEGITNLTGLVALNLSRNNLVGLITPKIGLLRNLLSLDLSRNQLYGEIPMSISNLSFLSQLDLSANNLSGKIPIGTQIQSFDASAFLGNPKLCGSPLPNECLEDLHPNYINNQGHKKENDDDDGFITNGFYVAASLGFIVGFWGVCCISVLNIRDAADAQGGLLTSVVHGGWTFADLVAQKPQPLPEVDVPLRSPKWVENDCPSLDVIRSFICSHWGIVQQPMVSSMRSPQNVFVQFANEDDFLKAFARESCDIDGVHYRVFYWTTDFCDEVEPSLVPVWIFLPDLPQNYYHPLKY
ncbi:receptor-like protein EIX1 [Juglans microcarpa x Juglans regia]|uniref:receptor-like protein EIX1 n=1 Tax=Juglans microcarpa x Juglans regia TaxID=2249226 RepID=UPI001B7EB794|nr:receptor-like protein EIX1 [Juglans microcarpa x Juglans regia]